MEWPVVFKESLIIGNKESNLAICCLWSEKEKIAELINKENYSVVGNLYSETGTSGIVRNILANPNIRHVIIFGNDFNKSAEALVKLFNGETGLIEEEIDKDAVKEVIEKVKLLDLRGKTQQEFIKTVEELGKKQTAPFSQPQIFPEKKKSVKKIPSEQTGFIARGKNIAETWLKVLDFVMKFGTEKPSEYPVKQKELLNVIAVINKGDEMLPEWLDFTDKDLRKYMTSILTPFKPAEVTYTYGERLFKREDEINKSQMETAIERLKKAPHTRRAIAFTWRVKDDAREEGQPCLTQLLWSIQDGKLFQTVHFRSHDIFSAWPMNLFALKEMQELIAKELNIEAGPLTSISHSAHIYENKWDEAKKVLKENYKQEAKLNYDERGVFKITAKDKIRVEHFTINGESTGHIFESGNAKEILDKIFHENLISRLDHAAYLGSELQKAELALKTGKEYIQDKLLAST